MQGEIIYSIPIDDLVKELESREGININKNHEYIVLKPKFVDDYLEVKILYSNLCHPTEWRDYENIKKEWNE